MPLPSLHLLHKNFCTCVYLFAHPEVHLITMQHIRFGMTMLIANVKLEEYIYRHVDGIFILNFRALDLDGIIIMNWFCHS